VLLGFFAAIAIALAAIGVWRGRVAVSQRTREIGIRMALGAARADVLALVVRQVWLTLTGITAGLAAAAGAMLPRRDAVRPLPSATFIVVAIAFAAVSTCASYVPARATRCSADRAADGVNARTRCLSRGTFPVPGKTMMRPFLDSLLRCSLCRARWFARRGSRSSPS
jgi:hypothetical protein